MRRRVCLQQPCFRRRFPAHLRRAVSTRAFQQRWRVAFSSIPAGNDLSPGTSGGKSHLIRMTLVCVCLECLSCTLIGGLCNRDRDIDGCLGNSIPQPDNSIRLGALLSLNDVELNVIALFQRFVSIQLDGRVVNEHIRPVFPPDESVPLRVVEPLDLSFVLSHRLLPFSHPVQSSVGKMSWGTPTYDETLKMQERFFRMPTIIS
jgi:hypothetical protein